MSEKLAAHSMTMNKDKCSDKSRFMKKNDKLILLIRFLNWYNNNNETDIKMGDIEEFLARDCPYCKHKSKFNIQEWKKCKICT